MIAAARERSMVLIELCAVVPFERMIEDFHELLVRQRMGTVRAAEPVWHCLLYTSDAADERSSVDLGGRRIIKKKKYRR